MLKVDMWAEAFIEYGTRTQGESHHLKKEDCWHETEPTLN